jgi:hypothetical protein
MNDSSLTKLPSGLEIPQACPCGHNMCAYVDCSCYNCRFLQACRREEYRNNGPLRNVTVQSLTPMDAGVLRQIAAKVDDDCIDVNDAQLLRDAADRIEALEIAYELSRRQATSQAKGHDEEA